MSLNNKINPKPSTANKLFYDSFFFRDKADRSHSFSFSSLYSITPEHGSWTRDLDIMTTEYVFEHELIKYKDKALYDLCKTLANRSIRLSTEAIASHLEEKPITTTARFDRLQDCFLGHRVYREDLRGKGFDFVIHSPLTAEQLRNGQADLLRKRIAANFTRNQRLERLVEKTYTRKDGVEITQKMRDWNNYPDALTMDLREIRQLFHAGLSKDETDGKIPRKFWKPDKKSNLFFTICLDALRELRKVGYYPIIEKTATAPRTENWKVFKSILKRFSDHEDIQIDLNDGRYKAAWKFGNYYAPNMFTYVLI